MASDSITSSQIDGEKMVDFVSLGRFGFNPQNDLAAAAIASLKTSGLFSNVTKANNIAQAASADYVWRSSVTSTFYRGRMFSYCISYFFSPVLWVVGFPSGPRVHSNSRPSSR